MVRSDFSEHHWNKVDTKRHNKKISIKADISSMLDHRGICIHFNIFSPSNIFNKLILQLQDTLTDSS